MENLNQNSKQGMCLSLVLSHRYENYFSNPQGNRKGKKRQGNQEQLVSILFHLGLGIFSSSFALLGTVPTKDGSWKQPIREESAGLERAQSLVFHPASLKTGEWVYTLLETGRMRSWSLSVSYFCLPIRLQPYQTFSRSKEYLDIVMCPNLSKEKSKEKGTELALPYSELDLERALRFYI